MLFGFLKKQGRQQFTYWHTRWVFLISQRPLDKEAYVIDSDYIGDGNLPALIEFNTLYYYRMNDENDDSIAKGEIKALDIDNISLSEKKNEYGFVIDAGPKKYEFQAATRFICERWVEALEVCQKTAKEQ